MRILKRSHASRGSAAIATLVSLLAACSSDPPGRVLVVVGTDFVVPMELSMVRVETGAGESFDFPVDEEAAADSRTTFAMPFSFAVVPKNGDESREVTLVLRGFLNRDGTGEVVSTRRVVTSFIRGQTRLLPIHLSRACTADRIAACVARGQTCERGMCIDDEVVARDLMTAPPPGGELDAGGLVGTLDAHVQNAPDAGVSTADSGSPVTLGDGGVPQELTVVRRFGLGTRVVHDVEVDALGGAFLCGSDVGTTPAVGFVEYVDLSTGMMGWRRTLTGSGNSACLSIDYRPLSQEIAVLGTTTGPSHWTDAGDFPSGDTVVVALIDRMGTIGWSDAYPGILDLDPAVGTTSLVAWSGTRVVVTGSFTGTLTLLRGPERTSAPLNAPAGQTAGFIALLHGSGADMNPTTRLPNAQIDDLAIVTNATSGGRADGIVGFAGGTFMSAHVDGGADLVLQAYTTGTGGFATAGAPITLQASGDLHVSAMSAIAPQTPGGARGHWIAGTFLGTISRDGASVISSMAGRSAFAIYVDPDHSGDFAGWSIQGSDARSDVYVFCASASESSSAQPWIGGGFTGSAISTGVTRLAPRSAAMKNAFLGMHGGPRSPDWQAASCAEAPTSVPGAPGNHGYVAALSRHGGPHERVAILRGTAPADFAGGRAQAGDTLLVLSSP